ncbi:MAG: tRNA (adenosine(37)-N6)-threonylcarbamoyltransferase complex dimerization subunit type 1 TsaB [Actinobacteria bacterium]|nr:tRNA (adenosine(37)-N6)-threonylcarbamoyltransferase complex dimerization subunit type 1 TsaB [Actinomycetota bacterium]
MRIVAIESATPAASVALAEGREVVGSSQRVDRRGHVAFLVPALEFLFDQAGWSPGDVDVVAVDVGPGLFGGIRAGLSTAQALAGAVGARLAPVSSLDAVALRAATAHRKIWAVVDARRGEYAVAPYQPVPGGVVREGGVELVSAEAFRAILASDRRDGLVVGDWEALPESVFRGLHGIKTGRPRYPAADAVVDLALARAERDDLPHPDEVRPRYLREPDVRINWTDFRREEPWR